MRRIGKLGRVRRAVGVTVAASCCAAILPAAVSAYDSFGAPVAGQAALISGLPGNSSSGAGPSGLLDDGTHLFAVDAVNGTMYRFGDRGGSVSSASTLKVADGLTNGIATLGGPGGTYYAGSRGVAGVSAGVYSFDPTTLARGRQIASLENVNEILADPKTGDLYVTAYTDGLYRIENPASSDPSVFEVAVGDFHGIGMTSNDADVWISNVYVGGPGVKEYALRALDAISPTSGCSPSDSAACAQPIQTVSLAKESPQLPTGLVVMPAGATLGTTHVGNDVIVNTSQGDTDLPGEVLRVDTSRRNAISVLASGGSTRGDVAMLDSHGYLDMTQTDSVVRLEPAVTPHLTYVFFFPRSGGLDFHVSQAATVTVLIRQMTAPHRSSRRLRVTLAAQAGANGAFFPKLPSGRYALSVTAADGPHAISKPVIVAFTLRRGARGNPCFGDCGPGENQ